jgi:hypothetical protein
MNTFTRRDASGVAVKKTSISPAACPVLLPALLVVLIVLALPGCSKPQVYAKQVPPYLPAPYYNCIETSPTDLAEAYFNNCAEIELAKNRYNDQYFVFKNLELKQWMVADINSGWLWVSGGIKCLLVNTPAVKAFKLGERIDLVGYNSGVDEEAHSQLVFKDCYVMQTGLVQLPSTEGQVVIAGY